MTTLERLAQWIEKQEAPGPPPREGLKWKPQTHRWIRPKETSKPDPRAGTAEDPKIAELSPKMQKKVKNNIAFRDHYANFHDASRTSGTPEAEDISDVYEWLMGDRGVFEPNRIKGKKDSDAVGIALEDGRHYYSYELNRHIGEALVGGRFPSSEVRMPKRHIRKIIDITLSAEKESADQIYASMPEAKGIAGRATKPASKWREGSARHWEGKEVNGAKIELFDVNNNSKFPLDFAQTVVHEMSHAVYFDTPYWFRIRINHLYLKALKSNKGLPSQYSKEDVHEFFAESYTAYVSDTKAFRKRNPSMASELDNLFSKTLKDRGARWTDKAYDYPSGSDEYKAYSLGLTAEEYHMMEWNSATSYTDEERSRPVKHSELLEYQVTPEPFAENVLGEDPEIITDPEDAIGFEEDLESIDPIEMPEIPEESFEDTDIENQAPPGPPPREGLVWRPQTHRWIRPEEVTTGEHDTDFSSLVDEFMEIEFNDLLHPQEVVSHLVDSVIESRNEALGEQRAKESFWKFNDWIEGQIFMIIGMRTVLAEMRGEGLDKEAIRSQISNATGGGETSDSSIDLAIQLGTASMTSISRDDDGNLSASYEGFQELLKDEQQYAEKRTRELFGDSITAHRTVYGSAAVAIREALEETGEAEIESFPMSSYTMDPIAAFAFGTQQGEGQPYIIFTREIPAEDILAGWYTHDAFLDNMPNQKEVVINPAELKFTITNDDIHPLSMGGI